MLEPTIGHYDPSALDAPAWLGPACAALYIGSALINAVIILAIFGAI